MSITDNQTEPKLDAPGAGLPAIELFFAKLMFRVQRWRNDRSAWDALFEAECAEIIRLVGEVDDETAGRRILVDRIRGLEDSSRFWSVYMVLDHLNIVNKTMLGAIVSLTKGSVPDGKASTADVKPATDSDSSTVETFEKECSRFRRLLDKTENLKTAVRYAHPWFGPLDAAGWHALAAFHMRLHRKQIEMILAGSNQCSANCCGKQSDIPDTTLKS